MTGAVVNLLKPIFPASQMIDNRIAWLYDGEHHRNPILLQAVRTLTAAGYSVCVYDRSRKRLPKSVGYRHQPCPIAVINSYQYKPGKTRQRTKKFIYFSSLLAGALTFRARTVFASLPTAAMVGWWAKKISGARLIYYPFELFGEQHYPVIPYWKEQEEQVLRHGVDVVLTQNQMRARVYREERGCRVEPVILHNYKPWKAVQATGKLRQRLPIKENDRIVLYEGIIAPGRSLHELVQAARYFPEDVKLVLMGKKAFRWFDEDLQPFIEKQNLGQKVLVAPQVPFDEVASFTADADVGVMIYDDKVRNNVFCEPGKLSDYALAGVPMIGPNYPSLAPRILGYNIGHVFPSFNPGHLATAALNVLSKPRDEWKLALERAAREMIWETQAPVLLETVRETIAHGNVMTRAA
jgi:glycosyltransferase involved in cell wall biosynthesis